MDSSLCDELLQEILQRLPPSSSSSVSLVSRRWLSLHRSSLQSLSLRLPCSDFPLTTILSHYPFLTSLTIVSGSDYDAVDCEESSSNDILLAVAAAPSHHRLLHLHLHLRLPSPLSPSTLLSTSPSLSRLTSLHLSSLARPLSLRWLLSLPSLHSLSLHLSPPSSWLRFRPDEYDDYDDDDEQTSEEAARALPLETLSLSGVRAADRGLSWLWRRLLRLHRLALHGCDGTGDGPSSPLFALVLPGLASLELRACRPIADRVLLRAADHCRRLSSLLLHDGAGRDALRHLLLARAAAGLSSLDLRLPLDLHNDHLHAIAHSAAARLSTLRLQSCCLLSGDGLRSLAHSGAAIHELALINCDVVEREPGLLTFLAQSMRRLRRLDLSHNESLADKEVGAMLESCGHLVELALRGCRALTDAAILSIVRCCGRTLEVVDVSRCPRFSANGVETLLLNAGKLSWVVVEDDKVVSQVAKDLVSRRAIKISQL